MRALFGVLLSSWISVDQAATLKADLQEFVDHAAAHSGTAISLAVILESGEELTAAAGATDASTFLFGSGTKPYVATRVLQLAEQGALSLEDFAAEHIDPVLRALSGNATLESLFGSSAHEVTIAMLLGMRSGVADFDVLSFDARVLATADRTHPPSEFLEYAATVEEPFEQHFVCEPGTCVNYSSTNYQLLGLLLLRHAPEFDAADSTSWARLDLKSALFGSSAASFPRTSFVQTGSLSSQLDVAGVTGTAPAVVIASQDASILGWTCGNLVSTPLEVARFFRALLRMNSLVSAASLAEMTRFAPIDNGWGAGSIAYGLGLMIQQTSLKKRATKPPSPHDDGAYVGHGGDTYGFLSEQGFYPTINATIAVVANSDAKGYFVKNVLACGAYKIVAKATLTRAVDVRCLKSDA